MSKAVTADQIIVSEGSVFAISSLTGDIHPKTIEGFYAYDTRFLSAFHITIEGRELESVATSSFDHSMASFYTVPRGRQTPAGINISIVRDRYVSEGLHEDISVVNHTNKVKDVRLKVELDADFADTFEVRLGPVPKLGKVTIEEREGQHLAFVYKRDEFHRETWVKFSAEPVVKEKMAIFHIRLSPKGCWKTCVTVLPVVGAPPSPMRCIGEILGPPFGAYRRQQRPTIKALKRTAENALLEQKLPRLETEHIGLRQAYQQALADLQALRIEVVEGYPVLAAGAPWLMTLFGRDSIIAAIQTKLLGPELMVGTLYTLASLQAREFDEFREAEPGKIPHEVRKGELSVLEEIPHSRYYGSVDATPLFIVLLSEAYRWTGDIKLVQQLLPAAEKAIEWVDRYGDMDGDGFIEYKSRTSKRKHGLRNQGWKDSNESIAFSDGRLAEPPIALCEVQGYVYDAKMRMAELYRVLGKQSKAKELERQSDLLKKAFHEAFWMPKEKFFALALDKKKRQVDAIASNPGHCLWSGIIEKDKAKVVVERLMKPDMFSGWGIRTLSTEMARYNPLSYHNGSVWPHDNSIIAAGMARYGFMKEANEVAWAIIEAASSFQNHRLPELFAGYPRREYSFPVPYPAANCPQAWSSGAIIYLLETMLGASPQDERLLREAPLEGISISLKGIQYRGSKRVL